MQKYSNLVSLGLQFPSAIIVGFGFGYLFDRWLHTDPWGKIVGFILGMIAGYVNFFREYKKLNRESKKP
jgi:F0F1-type ATP synthase assembly protein I